MRAPVPYPTTWPAREGNARVLSRALELLPEAIEEVMIRSDSAGHSAEVLQLCSRPELRPTSTRRFGVIGFAISAVRSQELMAEVARVLEAEWTPWRVLEKRTPEGGGKPVLVEVDSATEAIAEVNFVSNEGRLQQARRDRPATSPSGVAGGFAAEAAGCAGRQR